MLLFCLLFIALFVGFAIKQGIGDPDIPPDAVAIVEDTPDGTRTITRAEFDRELHRAGVEAQADLAVKYRHTPTPEDPNYEELRDRVMTSLIATAWTEAEAAERDIEVSPFEVGESVHEYKTKFYSSEAKFQKYMKENGITLEVIRRGFKISNLQARIAYKIKYGQPEATDREVRDYYEEQKPTAYTSKPSRTVRLVVIGDEEKAAAVKAELTADDSPKAWEKVVAKYSKDPASQENLGLFESVTEEALERSEPLKGAVFTASTEQVEGPLKTPAGYYVFEVMRATPEEVTPLNEDTKSGIRSSIGQRKGDEAIEAFEQSYQSKWRSRTFCADGFVVEQCDNYKSKSPLAAALPTCLEEQPKYSASTGCPAPVEQAKPAMPGSVSLVEPHGEQRPQAPRPAGAEQELPEPPIYWLGAPPPESTTEPPDSPKEAAAPKKEASEPQSQDKPKGAVAQVESGQIKFDLAVKGNKSVKVRAVMRGTLGNGTEAVVLGKGESHSTPDGKLSLSIVLTPAAKRALEAQSELPVTVTMTVSAPGGKEETASQKIVLQAE